MKVSVFNDLFGSSQYILKDKIYVYICYDNIYILSDGSQNCNRILMNFSQSQPCVARKPRVYGFEN